MTRALDIQNAFQHAATLATQHEYRDAHLYLDLAEALIEGPDEAVEVARERCIEADIHRYHTTEWCGCQKEDK